MPLQPSLFAFAATSQLMRRRSFERSASMRSDSDWMKRQFGASPARAVSFSISAESTSKSGS